MNFVANAIARVRLFRAAKSFLDQRANMLFGDVHLTELSCSRDCPLRILRGAGKLPRALASTLCFCTIAYLSESVSDAHGIPVMNVHAKVDILVFFDACIGCSSSAYWLCVCLSVCVRYLLNLVSDFNCKTVSADVFGMICGCDY